ncbi:MAG: cation diffusion facilitator family transporter [Clostridia bacterium]|nr:cation diffusion facilitator family transporter [Clostridia bacterium]
MTELLCRLFVRNHEHTSDPAVRRSYGTMVSVVGIVLNLLLAAGKLTVGLLFGAIAIQADAVNNLSDAGSQIISLVSFRIAAKPADRDHPFGHARIEYVASMIVSFAVLLVGWELLSGSIDKLLHPTETVFSWLSAIVLGVSVLVKLWLCLFNRRVAARIDSSVMRATSADSLSDAIATTAVLIASLIFRFTGFDIDAYMGVVVALLILWAGVKILNETKNSILGEGPSDEIVNDIRTVVGRYPDALGIHDLWVHNYGPGRIMASLHIEVDGGADMFRSHDMIDCIERQLRVEYGIEATVHMDPIVVNDPVLDALRGETEVLVRSIDERILIHDFRMVPGETHTNLIFDMAVPFEVKTSDEELRRIVGQRMADAHPGLFTVITVDRG